MKKEWTYLTKLTEGKPLTVNKITVDSENVAIEGEFELPPLAKLSAEDQVFIAVFVKCHGSIKEMEKHFGISYPTVKNRLNRIAGQLDFVDVETTSFQPSPLDLLERGEISVEDAIKQMNKGENHE